MPKVTPKSPKQRQVNAQDVARYLHDTFVRVANEVDHRECQVVPWEELRLPARDRYLRLAAAIMEKPPPGFTRT